MANGESELLDQTARAEGGQGFAEFRELRFLVGRRFVELVMAGAGLTE